MTFKRMQLRIDRTRLGLGELVIPDVRGGALAVSRFEEGKSDVQNAVQEGRYTDGGILTASRRTMVTMIAEVRAYGSTHAEMLTNGDAFMRSVQQFGFTITLDLLTGTRSYRCIPASVEPRWERDEFKNKTLVYVASIPRQP